MRDFKGMKRQRGRNRGGGGGGGGKPQQNANRAFDSNGPDGVKVRGNAQHVFEKYQQLARDASSAGDRVLAENYQQHAEHYFRLLRAIQPNRPASEILGRDQFVGGYDIDFEDESGQQAAAEADAAAPVDGEGFEARQDSGERRDDRPRDRDGRDRDGRDRDGRERDGRDRDRGDWQPRDRDNRDRDGRDREGRDRDNRDRDNRDGRDRDRNRGDWQPRDRDGRDRDNRDRDGQPRDRDRGDRNRDRDRRDDRPRDDRPRDDRPRDDRPRGESEERRDRYEREPAPQAEAEAPRGPMLRDADGGASHAPAFLQARPVAAAPEDAEDKPKPRRRRAPRTFENGEGAPESGEG